MSKEIKVKQVERFDFLGDVYLIAVSEDGGLYQMKFGSPDWVEITRPTPLEDKN